jgi:MFS family permease
VLLQIPGAVTVDWIGARKKFFIWTVTPHRALYILIGLLPWIVPVGVAWAAMLMVGLVLVSMGLNNFGGQAWTNWMSDLVPPRVRGKFFAARSRLGVMVFCLSGLAVAAILDLCQQPWFNNLMAPISSWAQMPPLIFLVSIVFMVAGFVGMFDILMFTKVDEPRMREVSAEPWMRRLLEPLKDREFRRFLGYWSTWTAANSFCAWMWWLYLLGFFDEQKARGVNAWYCDHRFIAGTLILGVGFQSGQFLGYPMWGRAVDRFGRKPVLFVSSALHTTGWIWWIFLSPVLLPWLFLTQMVSGFMSGGQDIASFNMILQFNRRGGPGYQAVGSVIFSVVGAASTLIAGKLATVLQGVTFTIGEGTRYEHTYNHYVILIIIGIALKYLGDLVVLPMVHDVNGKSRTHALRYVIDNTYGNLNTLIFSPLRTGAKVSAELAGRSFDGVREAMVDVSEAVVDVASDMRDVASDVADAASENIKKFWR